MKTPVSMLGATNEPSKAVVLAMLLLKAGVPLAPILTMLADPARVEKMRAERLARRIP